MRANPFRNPAHPLAPPAKAKRAPSTLSAAAKAAIEAGNVKSFEGEIEGAARTTPATMGAVLQISKMHGEALGKLKGRVTELERSLAFAQTEASKALAADLAPNNTED